MRNRFRNGCGFLTCNLLPNSTLAADLSSLSFTSEVVLVLRSLLKRGLKGNVETLRQLDQPPVQ
jgi:hypothetical protein